MLKFLLIDDDVLEHKMFDCYLAAGQTVQYDLVSTADIDEAIDLLKAQSFDFIFLDDRFAPYKSALDTLPLLRKVVGAAKIVIISSSTDARHLKDPDDLNVLTIIDKFELRSVLSMNMERFEPLNANKAA